VLEESKSAAFMEGVRVRKSHLGGASSPGAKLKKTRAGTSSLANLKHAKNL